jgi:hypothetical protein
VALVNFCIGLKVMASWFWYQFQGINQKPGFGHKLFLVSYCIKLVFKPIFDILLTDGAKVI